IGRPCPAARPRNPDPRAQAGAARRQGCERRGDARRAEGARATIAAMTDLAQFPITRKWPPRHPDHLQLYSLPTPNGVKVSIALEEIGLAYEPHRVAFDRGEQRSAEFTSLNPYQKIPAILDPNGPG